jgi:acetolactate decarboxylase
MRHLRGEAINATLEERVVMNQNPNDGLERYPIYLCAPVNALVEGVYEERIPYSDIKKHGDFGLGTFDSLDGEMVMLDGNIYQITADGRVSKGDDAAFTPFACVTFYQPAAHDELIDPSAYEDFLAWLERLLPSPNIFYALRIEGTFSYVKVRSVPKQDCYKPLVEVTKDQPVFEYTDVDGTLAGFFTPSFLSSLSVPGLHLHFLSSDFRRGGHLLECHTNGIRAGVQFIYSVELGLPMSLDYLTLDFRRDIAEDLDRAEK